MYNLHKKRLNKAYKKRLNSLNKSFFNNTSFFSEVSSVEASVRVTSFSNNSFKSFISHPYLLLSYIKKIEYINLFNFI